MWHASPSPFSGAASYCAYGKSHRPYTRALPVQQKLCLLVTLETPSLKKGLAMLPAGTWSLMDTALGLGDAEKTSLLLLLYIIYFFVMKTAYLYNK